MTFNEGQPVWNRIYKSREEAEVARIAEIHDRIRRGASFPSALESYFGNFGLNLPHPLEFRPGMGNYRRVMRSLGKYHEKYISSSKGDERTLFLFSPLRLNQTPNSFFKR